MIKLTKHTHLQDGRLKQHFFDTFGQGKYFSLSGRTILLFLPFVLFQEFSFPSSQFQKAGCPVAQVKFLLTGLISGIPTPRLQIPGLGG